MAEENILKYYVICNKLKDVIRTGWKDWHVKRDRVESVAEHVFGTQMLALAIYSEYKYDVDIMKVLFMLAIHEIGESIIGDITQFQAPKEEKEKWERDAVHNILQGLLSGEDIEKLFLEFDMHETKESMFAYQCDKLECDLQCKLYDEEHCVDMNHQEGNNTMDHPIVQMHLQKGSSWSEMWLDFDLQEIPYDDNFRAISKYAMNHEISKIE